MPVFHWFDIKIVRKLFLAVLFNWLKIIPFQDEAMIGINSVFVILLHGA